MRNKADHLKNSVATFVLYDKANQEIHKRTKQSMIKVYLIFRYQAILISIEDPVNPSNPESIRLET